MEIVRIHRRRIERLRKVNDDFIGRYRHAFCIGNGRRIDDGRTIGIDRERILLNKGRHGIALGIDNTVHFDGVRTGRYVLANGQLTAPRSTGKLQARQRITTLLTNGFNRRLDRGIYAYMRIKNTQRERRGLTDTQLRPTQVYILHFGRNGVDSKRARAAPRRARQSIVYGLHGPVIGATCQVVYTST